MNNQRQPEDKWFTRGQIKLHYVDWGSPGAAPMVLVHAFTGSARYWDFFARDMRREYHVIALDQRGHGDSSRALKYGPREYGADLAAFVKELDLEGIVLVGHSLGGINAILYAAEHPERVSRLVIVDIGPEISAAGLEEIKSIMESRPDSFGSEEEAFRRIRQERHYHTDAFIRHLVKNTLQRDTSGRLTYKYDPALRHAKMASSDWLWPYLKQVTCPTLIVRGAESVMLLPEAVEKMMAALPSAKVVEVSRATHGVPGDNPEGFTAAVREFLAGK